MQRNKANILNIYKQLFLNIMLNLERERECVLDLERTATFFASCSKISSSAPSCPSSISMSLIVKRRAKKENA